ncbi:hypothetical protein CU102_02350 [Phyllobacterium brassicacearum]|uniref:Glycosyl transferase n=1 Tax=Phyllobacterium brassicacearum TaxID=314235 RepID=A0A2P7BWS2_9HYPH|nr:DUF6492 family protein [Phyllobacterium brassicacearum]PSH70905.1 hypothetical protein CU102_02350 [Phyllobacterium brassicacearum]TDQ35592.1 hypothetical protein DEV91_10174 [Phyllobacterium brassicacearum]
MRTALVTASYAPDFDRCKLLCETIDRFVTGFTKHYILVEHRDVALFRKLEGPHRVVITENDLLPRWIRPFPDPSNFGRRRIWLSPYTMPLRGWHVQQFRRIAIAAHADEDAFFYIDSDVAFLKPFDCASVWRGGDLRLFRRDGDLLRPGPGEQRIWSEHAGQALGIVPVNPAGHDYIGTLIAWRRDALLSMCERIERVTGRHWIAAIGRSRRFSECMIYGRYADEVLMSKGHYHDVADFCRVYWLAPAPTDKEFAAFVEAMTPEQVAIGMQSFLGDDTARIRKLLV